MAIIRKVSFTPIGVDAAAINDGKVVDRFVPSG
jgi:hypothetical protein